MARQSATPATKPCLAFDPSVQIRILLCWLVSGVCNSPSSQGQSKVGGVMELVLS
jgi:hypothetical protein